MVLEIVFDNRMYIYLLTMAILHSFNTALLYSSLCMLLQSKYSCGVQVGYMCK